MSDPSLAISQSLQAQSQGVPGAPNAQVSAPPGFGMPANQLPLDMGAQGIVYVPQLDGKDFPGILPQNTMPVGGVNPSMQNMRAPNAASGPNNQQSHVAPRVTSRPVKNDPSLSTPARGVNDKTADDLPISERMPRVAARSREEALQKANGDQSVKLKPSESGAKAKSGAISQSVNAKSAQQNQPVHQIDGKDASRNRSAPEPAKGKGGVGLSRSGSVQGAVTAMANAGVKNKGGDTGEGESRSAKSERHTPGNRGGTPSQKSTASGGSNAVERRGSQGAGTSKRQRSRNKGRSPGGNRRSRAGGQSGRNSSSKNAGAGQTPRTAVNDMKNATALNAQMKSTGKTAQGELSTPVLHSNAVMSGLTDGSVPEKARQAKNDANIPPKSTGARQPAKAGDEVKRGFNGNAGDNNNEQAAQNAPQGRQSPGPLSGAGDAQLFGMESMTPFNIVSAGHNGKVNVSTGANYPYELSNFLGTGVEDEAMLGNIGNIGNMLNNMQENVDLGSTEFEDDSILEVTDAGDLIGRNRT